MAGLKSILVRAVAATPFLALARLCLQALDIDKLIAHQQPFLESRRIEWEAGSIPIRSKFHPAPLAFLDDIWRGTTVTFSPGTIGYDAVAWWQMFTFLNDLGIVYALWIIESCRSANAYRPAYLSTFYLLAAQFLGIGTVAPLYYFLCLAFGPSATYLARSPDRRAFHAGPLFALLPLLLSLHTWEVFQMFTAQAPEERHYWAWAWQMTPLWIGLSNLLLTGIRAAVDRTVSSLKVGVAGTPMLIISVMSLVSVASWIHMLMRCPFSFATLFLPERTPQEDFVAHTRLALQSDELYCFVSSFLWILYSFFDLWWAGIVPVSEVLLVGGALPLIASAGGPGLALAAGWIWRERKMSAKVESAS